VAAAGAILAFAANALSPRGLNLSRNFFLETRSPQPPTTNSTSARIGPIPAPAAASDAVAARLQGLGLRVADSKRVAQLFEDPRCQQDLVVFVDARNDHDYQQGHVPGAYQLDYYHPENYLPTVLPLCQVAQEVVVYCNGGDCEDSERTALFLRDAGIPADKLYVYAGGITEWQANHLPVELGLRKSGQLRTSP